MSGYRVTWITERLCVGHAPMSHDDLNDIKEQGIRAIVNLCGEYCDLHEIEEGAGFEVFYLPIPDENAPPMEDMEEGLAWLDEALYLGKKVLVHCKLGVGRTGTFVTAYLLRRGFNLKKAGKLLKKAKARANPTNYCQWKTLRKFGRQEGVLRLREPSAQNQQTATDLRPLYDQYLQLVKRVETDKVKPQNNECVWKDDPASQIFDLMLIEALFLNEKINASLSSQKRQEIIERATGRVESDSSDLKELVFLSDRPDVSSPGSCPLQEDGLCLLHAYRPIHCRSLDYFPESSEIQGKLKRLSRDIFVRFFGADDLSGEMELPAVSNLEAFSGKFIQRYFHFFISQNIIADQHAN